MRIAIWETWLTLRVHRKRPTVLRELDVRFVIQLILSHKHVLLLIRLHILDADKQAAMDLFVSYG